MNTWIKQKLQALNSRMVFRLWAIMMVLVLFGVGFMWVVQIYLFEQNYANASLAETRKQMSIVMESLASEDISHDEHLLDYLSHINSELFLVSEDGDLLQMYSAGHPVKSRREGGPDREEQMIWDSIQQDGKYEQLQAGMPYEHVLRRDNHVFGYEMGFPVTYDGRTCYLITRNQLQITRTVIDLNRKQLITMSVFLTAAASLLAALLSRQFTRPIYAIKAAVDRLTKNDFTAVPALKRNDELGQLSRSVEELGGALQKLEVLRKEVIANVSHELRSPLSLIAGYAEMVRDITWNQEEQRNEDLNLIIRESRRMSDMVSDILDYSQLQAGYSQLRLADYNLYDMLESETAWYRHMAEEHRITLDLESEEKDLVLRIDASKMNQVIRNLLNNAINHTADGGTVYIRVRRRTPEENARDAGDAGNTGDVRHGKRPTEAGASGSSPQTSPRWHVAFCNPGPPIPEEERALIWERYQRSQHQSGRRLGTGIGLSIVRTILDAHGMSYGVDCRDGWNVFWFDC